RIACAGVRRGGRSLPPAGSRAATAGVAGGRRSLSTCADGRELEDCLRGCIDPEERGAGGDGDADAPAFQCALEDEVVRHPMCGRKLGVPPDPPTYVAEKTAVRDVVMPGFTGLPVLPTNVMSIARSVSSASSPPTT